MDKPKLVLVLVGPQGSGKTTLANYIEFAATSTAVFESGKYQTMDGQFIRQIEDQLKDHNPVVICTTEPVSMWPTGFYDFVRENGFIYEAVRK